MPGQAPTTITLPADDELLSTRALADVMGWSSAEVVHNRKAAGRSLPESIKVGRGLYFPGSAVRDWLLSGASAAATDHICAECGKGFDSQRGLSRHIAHKHAEDSAG